MGRKKKIPTLSEVAKRAGVGTSTVSRVINGGQRASPETLTRVRHVIENLGYVPNLAARISGEVALLGYDDFESAATLRPSISVIEQPIEEIGRLAAEFLFAHMFETPEGPRRPAKPRLIQLETRLVPRSSCGCSPRLPETAKSE